MNLRRLKKKDAPQMLEWMHDQDIAKNFSINFPEKTLEDCRYFIDKSEDSEDNLYLAIVSDRDEYMGTVSLKHIDRQNGNAELGIAVRKSAMGKGYSQYAMTEILQIAFEKLGLENVYWCVSKNNVRACRFYDKCAFHQTTDIEDIVLNRYPARNDLIWYSVLRSDNYKSGN